MTKKKKASKKKKVKTAKKVTPTPVIGPEKQNITPHPTGDRIIKEFEETLQSQLAEETDPEAPKRGRGRPRKTDQPEAPAIDLTLPIISNAIKIPFDLWASSTGVEQLKLLDSEADQLAEPVKQLLDHYLPTMPPIAVAWLSLAFAGYFVMKSRLDIVAAIRKKKKEASPSSEDQGSSIQGDGAPLPDLSNSESQNYDDAGPSGFPKAK